MMFTNDDIKKIANQIKVNDVAMYILNNQDEFINYLDQELKNGCITQLEYNQELELLERNKKSHLKQQATFNTLFTKHSITQTETKNKGNCLC